MFLSPGCVESISLLPLCNGIQLAVDEIWCGTWLMGISWNSSPIDMYMYLVGLLQNHYNYTIAWLVFDTALYGINKVSRLMRFTWDNNKVQIWTAVFLNWYIMLINDIVMRFWDKRNSSAFGPKRTINLLHSSWFGYSLLDFSHSSLL